MSRMIRFNLSEQKVVSEEIPEAYKYLGGRGLSAAVLSDEVDPGADPFSSGNKCIIAPGLLGGSAVPCAGRLSVGGKSPLTGTIKEANSGGVAAHKLGRLGIRALIFEGRPTREGFILKVDREGVEILPGETYRGLGNYACVRKLRAAYGDRFAVISVGPSGERGYLNSTVAVSDMDGIPTRQAARGGLGALLASKGVKAILIDDRGTRVTRPARPAALKEACRTFTDYLLGTKKPLRTYGTSVVMNPVCALGGLPTHNFSRGQFEGVQEICGEALHDLIKERGGEGKTAHICSPGCVIACSNVFPDRDGKRVVSSLEYETMALMGSNLEISSLDRIAALNFKCNDYGLDTIETGVTLGIAMEAGLIGFGDGEGALGLVDEIGEGSLRGKVLGNGAETAGKVLGVRRIPTVKGQALPAYDPRVLKGTGTTCAMNPGGADHTAANLLPGRGGLDCTAPEGQVDLSLNVQIAVAALDTLGLCIMTGSDTAIYPYLSDLLSGFTGESWTEEKVVQWGRSILRKEYMFNRLAGWGPAHDRLPDFFREEALPPFNRVYDVSYNEIQEKKGLLMMAEGG